MQSKDTTALIHCTSALILHTTKCDCTKCDCSSALILYTCACTTRYALIQLYILYTLLLHMLSYHYIYSTLYYYICSHTTIYTHTTIYGSAYYCVCVCILLYIIILLYMGPAYYCVCVCILLYMPTIPTTLILLYIPKVYVSAY